MLDTYILMGFIWLIGWLFACGRRQYLGGGKWRRIGRYLRLFLTWPWSLGHGV